MPLNPPPAPEELIWRIGAPYICNASLFWFLVPNPEGEGVLIRVQKPNGYQHTVGCVSRRGLELYRGDWDAFGIRYDDEGFPHVRTE